MQHTFTLLLKLVESMSQNPLRQQTIVQNSVIIHFIIGFTYFD